jgi:hypothetical protein
MCGGDNGGGTPTLFFSNSFQPQNCYGLVLMLLPTCNGSGYGCPLGCHGKKGCGNVEFETKPRLDGKSEPIVNIYLFANTNL